VSVPEDLNSTLTETLGNMPRPVLACINMYLIETTGDWLYATGQLQIREVRVSSAIIIAVTKDILKKLPKDVQDRASGLEERRVIQKIEDDDIAKNFWNRVFFETYNKATPAKRGEIISLANQVPSSGKSIYTWKKTMYHVVSFVPKIFNNYVVKWAISGAVIVGFVFVWIQVENLLESYASSLTVCFTISGLVYRFERPLIGLLDCSKGIGLDPMITVIERIVVLNFEVWTAFLSIPVVIYRWIWTVQDAAAEVIYELSEDGIKKLLNDEGRRAFEVWLKVRDQAISKGIRKLLLQNTGS